MSPIVTARTDGYSIWIHTYLDKVYPLQGVLKAVSVKAVVFDFIRKHIPEIADGQVKIIYTYRYKDQCRSYHYER